MSTEIRWEKVPGDPYEGEKTHLGEDPKKPIDGRGNVGQIFGYVGKDGSGAPNDSLHWHLSTVFTNGLSHTPNANVPISGNMQGGVEQVRARAIEAFRAMMAN